MSTCPLCNMPLPKAEYDPALQMVDMSEITKHIWNCGGVNTPQSNDKK